MNKRTFDGRKLRPRCQISQCFYVEIQKACEKVDDNVESGAFFSPFLRIDLWILSFKKRMKL